jgi:hypothetical protein
MPRTKNSSPASSGTSTTESRPTKSTAKPSRNRRPSPVPITSSDAATQKSKRSAKGPPAAVSAAPLPPDPRTVLRTALASLDGFSTLAGPPGRRLRPYQLEAGDAIVKSVLNREGKTFVVMMSRQAGKNELSAQLEAYLLTIHSAIGGEIVKAAPSFKPQIVNSELRIREILDTPLNRGRWQPHRGYYIQHGRARLTFFSADPSANVVGATASILLEVDEAQDVEEETYNRSFRPMASTTRATTVMYGTAWSDNTLLEKQRRVNEEHERRTGERLNFESPWEVVAAHNPNYRAFVEDEIARLGADHPTIRTQYMLQCISSAGRLFPPELLQRVQGVHARRIQPDRDFTYVAGVDIAGSVTEDGKPMINERDETVVTIAELDWRPTQPVGPNPVNPPTEASQPVGAGHRPALPANATTPVGAGYDPALRDAATVGVDGNRPAPAATTNPANPAEATTVGVDGNRPERYPPELNPVGATPRWRPTPERDAAGRGDLHTPDAPGTTTNARTSGLGAAPSGPSALDPNATTTPPRAGFWPSTPSTQPHALPHPHADDRDTDELPTLRVVHHIAWRGLTHNVQYEQPGPSTPMPTTQTERGPTDTAGTS